MEIKKMRIKKKFKKILKLNKIKYIIVNYSFLYFWYRFIYIIYYIFN